MLRVSYFSLFLLFHHGKYASAKIQKEPRYNLQTQGEIWPRPWKEDKTSVIFEADPKKIEFNVTGKDCPKIHKAIQRCKDYLNYLSNMSKQNFSQDNSFYNVQEAHENPLKALQINLSQDCEEYPHLDMDESYNLTVFTTSTLNSSSIWGIIRGMESFTQLFYLSNNFKNIFIKGTDIIDHPHYPHRGLLLDTARHYISKTNILKTLDAMAMNKMNVFHWHIADDESFPYQSTKFPEINNQAFHPAMVYTKSDLEEVRDYARDLGIRVLVEINIPGHSAYWEESHPEIITYCNYDGPTRSRPLNPTRNDTYNLLKELLQEMQDIFPDKYIHLGGDEVENGCWSANIQVEQYLVDHGSIDINIVLQMFFKNIFPLLKNGTAPIIWEDVFAANVALPKNALVQVYDFEDGLESIANILNSGFRGIQSAPYHLNVLEHEIDWFYSQEPRLALKKLVNETMLQNLVGGTACMWGAMVDDTNVLSRVWPRASGVAEVLWSETEGKPPSEMTFLRIEEHSCRMRRRGVPSQPAVGPAFCVV